MINMTEILRIRTELEKQGFVVERLSSGLWVIRDSERDLPVGVLPASGTTREWHNALRRLAHNGWLIWPPE